METARRTNPVTDAVHEPRLQPDDDPRVTLPQQDFTAFATALYTEFRPNATLVKALVQTRQHVRRIG